MWKKGLVGPEKGVARLGKDSTKLGVGHPLLTSLLGTHWAMEFVTKGRCFLGGSAELPFFCQCSGSNVC